MTSDVGVHDRRRRRRSRRRCLVTPSRCGTPTVRDTAGDVPVLPANRTSRPAPRRSSVRPTTEGAGDVVIRVTLTRRCGSPAPTRRCGIDVLSASTTADASTDDGRLCSRRPQPASRHRADTDHIRPATAARRRTTAAVQSATQPPSQWIWTADGWTEGPATAVWTSQLPRRRASDSRSAGRSGRRYVEVRRAVQAPRHQCLSPRPRTNYELLGYLIVGPRSWPTCLLVECHYPLPTTMRCRRGHRHAAAAGVVRSSALQWLPLPDRPQWNRSVSRTSP